MLETIPENGRFVAVSTPSVSPGACFTCKGTDGPFIDTRVQDAWLGAFYLCANCLREMARVLGITEDVNNIERIRAYEQGCADTVHRIKADIDGAFGALVDSIGSPASGDSGSHVLAVADATGVPEDSEGIPEDGAGPEDSGNGADASTVEGDGAPIDEGPALVPSSGSDGIFDKR